MEKKILLFSLIFIFSFNFISAILISEIMYAPENFNENYNEWIEIYNDGGSDVDLSNWTICGKNLLAGYVDYSDGQIKGNSGLVLQAGKYAIVSDGGTGAEVYSNFNISSGSLAIHVDASSLCGGLSNSGKEIQLSDFSGNLVHSVNYDVSLGALKNGKSLQLCSAFWGENDITPGSQNSCFSPQPPTNQTNSTPPTNSTNSGNSQNISSQNDSENVSESQNELSDSPQIQTVSTGNSVSKKNPEIIILNVNSESKNIKGEDLFSNLTKNDYAKYGLIGFSVLIVLLLLLKSKVFKKNYKTEFNEG